MMMSAVMYASCMKKSGPVDRGRTERTVYFSKSVQIAVYSLDADGGQVFAT